MKKIFLIPILIIIGGGIWFLASGQLGQSSNNPNIVPITPPNNPVACTMEAKLCPDGSYVSRTGPNCEFALCPDIPTSKKSGITGTVTLSPVCPVERMPPDPNCAPKFYSTSINIMASGSTRIVKTIQSDAKGMFSVDIAPGLYILQARGGSVLLFLISYSYYSTLS